MEKLYIYLWFVYLINIDIEVKSCKFEENENRGVSIENCKDT